MTDDDLSGHDFEAKEESAPVTESDLLDLLEMYNHGRETLMKGHEEAMAWVVQHFRAAYIEKTEPR